jgi:hypothetical protein
VRREHNLCIKIDTVSVNDWRARESLPDCKYWSLFFLAFGLRIFSARKRMLMRNALCHPMNFLVYKTGGHVGAKLTYVSLPLPE